MGICGLYEKKRILFYGHYALFIRISCSSDNGLSFLHLQLKVAPMPRVLNYSYIVVKSLPKFFHSQLFLSLGVSFCYFPYFFSDKCLQLMWHLFFLPVFFLLGSISSLLIGYSTLRYYSSFLSNLCHTFTSPTPGFLYIHSFSGKIHCYFHTLSYAA